MPVEPIGVTENIVLLPFQASNIPDAAGIAKAIEPASDEYVMMRNGSVTGMSVRHNADLTGGVITWRVTINGVASTVLTVVTDDTNQQALKTIGARKLTFVRGDRVGMDWTKTGTVAPLTTDVAALLELELENVER